MAEIAPRIGAESHPDAPRPPAAVLVAMVRPGEMAAAGGANGAAAAVLPKAEKGACVIIDVGCSGEGANDLGSDREGEKVCRICQTSPGGGEESSEMIQLGCRCKGDLGVAHRHCAEAWFKVKGNRCCEICGANAKNVTVEEDSRLMEEGHDRSAMNIRSSSESSGRVSFWRRQAFCNFLMACLIISFILLWFFRVSMF